MRDCILKRVDLNLIFIPICCVPVFDVNYILVSGVSVQARYSVISVGKVTL